jgi:hypothetical protein
MANRFRRWVCPGDKETGAGLEGAVQTWYLHHRAQIALDRRPVRGTLIKHRDAIIHGVSIELAESRFGVETNAST